MVKLLLSSLLNNIYSKYFILTSLLLLLPFVFVLNAALSNEKHHWDTLVEDYGNSIAEISSKQLTILLSKNNQIGLQSHLNDLTKQENIINAVIYDVDNKIIVQAGDIDTAKVLKNKKTITMPITLDSSVIGSLTITLSKNALSNMANAITLNVIFMLLIAAALLFLSKSISHKVSANNKPTKALTTQTKINNEKAPTQESTALLVLHIHAIEKLYRQLNAEARQKQFRLLQDLIKKVLTLYSGKQIAATTQTILIKFNGNDQNTCFSNALYSAYLLTRATQEQPSLLHFSSVLYDINSNIDACKALFEIKQQFNESGNENRILIQRKVVENSRIEEKVILDSNTENSQDAFVRVIDVAENYCQLLKNQLAHLLI